MNTVNETEPLSFPDKLLESFWKKVDKSGECWMWTAVKSSAGYGHLPYARNWGITTLAHRVSWIIHRGPIPEKLMVCHTCDNPSCVNPQHLFLGTQKRNMQDCKEKGRIKYVAHIGEDNGMAKVTPDQVLEIRESKLPHKALMVKFGISRSMVGKIKGRRSWRHI